MLYPEFCMNCKKILRIDDSRCVKCGQQVYEQYRKAVNVNGSNNSYEGEWFNGKPEGIGRYIFPDGSVYEGEVLRDKKHGNGKYIFPDGEIYEGEFKKDKRDGWGTYTWIDQDSYSGQWKNGLRHGYGTETHGNGYVFEGCHSKNLRHGRGTERFADGSVFDGNWKNGDRVGNFKETYPNGFVFEGKYPFPYPRRMPKKVHGVLPNGSQYTAKFKEGVLVFDAGGFPMEKSAIIALSVTGEQVSKNGSAYEQLLRASTSNSTEKGDILEAFSAVLLSRMGYTIEAIPGGSGDGGVDVLAYREDALNSFKIVVQCKNYSEKPVGPKEIRELMGTIQTFGAQAGFFFTTKTFSKAAKSFTAKQNGIELFDGDRLNKLSDEHMRSLSLDQIMKEALKWKSS